MSVADTLLPVVNSLQDVLARLPIQNQVIDLPQIVVVGSQSAGKSSVLEAICGRDILPRGTGIVTRCPLVLQLIQTNPDCTVKDADGNECAEWGEFTHADGKIFIKHEDICKEIVDQTDRLTGGSLNITTQSINLRLYSPNFIPLTLVDLPGLVKNVLQGQPKDLPAQISHCVAQYIKKENAIILAVCPANADVATADALCAAKEADPEGNRTIGVLTKVDIVDRGAEHVVVRILHNEEYKFKLGWVAVQNRSQEDIDNKKSIAEHLGDEAGFFSRHRHYGIFANRAGIRYLTQRLNEILIDHIQRKLPEVRDSVARELNKWEDILDKIGKIPESPEEKANLMLELIHYYVDGYICKIDGSSVDISTERLVGGAMIANYFKNELPKIIKPMDLLSQEKIDILIKNANGITPDLFFKNSAFNQLVRDTVRRLEAPSRECIEYVTKKLTEIAGDVPDDKMKAYTTLQHEMVAITCGLIKTLSRNINQFFQNYLRCQCFVNTGYYEFQRNFKEKVQTSVEKEFDDSTYDNKVDILVCKTISDKYLSQNTETKNNEYMTSAFEIYQRLICEQIQDMVIKTAGTFLIDEIRDRLQNHLITQLYVPGKINELMTEDPSVKERLLEGRQVVECLQRAESILNRTAGIRTVDDIKTKVQPAGFPGGE